MPLFTATFDPAWATVGLVVDGSFWPTPAVRTNLLVNPNFETAATPWAILATGTVARSTAMAHSGTASLAVTTTGASGEGMDNHLGALPGVIPGHTYTASCWVYTTIAVPIIFYSIFDVGGAPNVVVTPAINTWTRISVTTVAPAGATTVRTSVRINAAHTPTVFYVDDVMLEESPNLNSYFDGDTPDVPPTVYAWTGTPGASTSTETTYAITNITITRQVTGQEDLPVRGVESLAVLGGYFVGSDPEAPLESSVTYRVDGYLAAVFVQSATATVDTTGAVRGLWLKVPGDPSATVRCAVIAVGDVSSPTIGGIYQIIGGGAVSQAVASWSGISADQLGVTLQVEPGDALTRVRAALEASRVLLIQPVNVQDVDAGWYFVGNVSRSNPGQYDSYLYRLVSLGLTRVGVPAGDGQGIPGWSCAAVLDTYATCTLMLAAKATCFDLLQGV